jgi:hypothetical protein
LRKLIQTEGERYPELFAEWRVHGPGKTWSALASSLARLAHAGFLEIDDPDVAARQFLTLINTDIQMALMFGDRLTEKELTTAAANAVRTFLRAYGRR